MVYNIYHGVYNINPRHYNINPRDYNVGFIMLRFKIFGFILGFNIVMLEWYRNISKSMV